MAIRERAQSRPLSPHLQVYRWQITMTMSILHRASGVVLTVGAFGLAWWLLALAAGGEQYAHASALVASPVGLVLLFGFSLSLVYHLLNGLRHLMWDMHRFRAYFASGVALWSLWIVLAIGLLRG